MDPLKIINTVVNEFIKKYPDKKIEMEQNKHSFSSNNFVSPNPHHLEDSTWAHTMMTLTALKCLLSEEYDEKEIFILATALMIHDYGKVITRKEDPSIGKVSFICHGEYSTSLSIEFTLHLLSEEFKQFNDNSVMVVSTVAWLCSRHMAIYDIKNIEDLHSFVNYKYDKYKLLKLFAQCDDFGRMKTSDSRDRFFKLCEEYDNSIASNIKINNPLIDDSKVDFYIYSGYPGSGKDYDANSNNLTVISFDQLRIEYYKINTKDDISSLNKDQIYRNAFLFCNNENVDLNKLLVSKLKALRDLKNIKNKIAICNTNLHIKPRRMLINTIKSIYPDATIGSRIMLTDINTCIERDIQRSSYDKTVGSNVINKLSNLCIPTYNENFNSLKYILYIDE